MSTRTTPDALCGRGLDDVTTDQESSTMTNHHHRYHQDTTYEAGYNDGFADAETGRSLRPDVLEQHDEGYRLGYANGQRYSLGLDLVEPSLPASRPNEAAAPTAAGLDRGVAR
jgi:hypothetical protein